MNAMTREESEQLEHLLDIDPRVAHDRIMRATRPPMPMIVRKEYSGKQPPLPSVADNADELPPLFSDEQIDVIAAALAEMRVEMRSEFRDMVNDLMAPLTEQVAVLQGQMSVMMDLIGSIVGNNGNGNNNSSKSIEASETRTTRRVRVRQSEDVRDLIENAIAQLSGRIDALKEDQQSLMPLEYYATVDKDFTALRERVATMEGQLSTIVSLLKGDDSVVGDMVRHHFPDRPMIASTG